MSDRIPVSIVILTLNEEARLPACLASVARCDDLVVIDSGSTDRTQQIARAAGARVLVNPFVNFAEQRNFAHAQANFRHLWVFHLDADELMTPELLLEIQQIVGGPQPLDGYYVAPRMLFHGQWLKRCTDYPAWQARLVNRDHFKFIQTGHGQREAPAMRMGYVNAGYTHDISITSETEWEAKHRRYARAEAAELMKHPIAFGQILGQVFASDRLLRRRALKHLSYSFPARPLLRFIYQYFLGGGFLDGAGAGNYCRHMSRYEGFTTTELKRLKTQRDA